MVKHMPVSHEDSTNIVTALERVLDVMDYLERQKATTEALRKVVDIKEKLDGLEECLVNDTRRFVLETSDILLESEDTSSRPEPYWYVTNSVPHERSTERMRLTIPNARSCVRGCVGACSMCSIGGRLFLFNDLLVVARQKGKRYKTVASFPLLEIRVLDVSDNTISILRKDKSLGIVFSSKAVKTAWYKQLQSCVFRIKKERYQEKQTLGDVTTHAAFKSLISVERSVSPPAE